MSQIPDSRVAAEGPSRIGLVAIGRNEGARLVRCLRSAFASADGGPPPRVVYVDSGSTDGSVDAARRLGAEVVELDTTRPFTAARGRNAGLAALRAGGPEPEYVQFVDGDCELEPGWLGRATRELDEDGGVAVVCGRRRERSREASPYNRLCDMEWDTPVGEADACGGDALFRVSALTAAGAWDESRIAGEEPELCFRLRAAGSRVLRVDAPMTVHDAELTRFGQWWRRAVRHGHALAEASATYDDPVKKRGLRSALFWGGLAPLAATGATLALALGPNAGLAWIPLVGLAAGYARLGRRVAGHRLRHGDSRADAWLYARFTVLGKLAEARGAAAYWMRRVRGGEARIIEYKDPLGSAQGVVVLLAGVHPGVSRAQLERELEAVEASGTRLRRVPEEPGPLLVSVALVAATRPLAFARAACVAARHARRSVLTRRTHAGRFARACALVRSLGAEPVAHVHVQAGWGAASVAFLCRLLGGPPYSFTLHGPEPLEAPDSGAHADRVRRARFVACTSHHGRAWLSRWIDSEDVGKLVLVRPGVDDSVRKHIGRPLPEPRSFVCVARLNADEGHAFLFDALALLAEEGLHPAVTLVGDGPLRTELESRVRALGLEGQVRFHGPLGDPETRHAVEAATVLVLPSLGDLFPTVLPEAMGLGRPVIGTFAAGVPELVRPDENGWLVPCGAAHALADALRAALDAPREELRQLGRNGRALVLKQHDSRRAGAQLAELLHGGAPPPSLPHPQREAA